MGLGAGQVAKPRKCSFATPPKLKQCVRKQIADVGERARFDKVGACFDSFTQFLRRRMRLVDSCTNQHPLFKPPAALNAEQLKKVKAINAKVMQLMKLSGFKKGSWKWVELATVALFWATVGDPQYHKGRDKISREYVKTYLALRNKHLIKYSLPIIKGIIELTKYPTSHNIYEWKTPKVNPWAGSKERRFIATDALSLKMGLCTEASNVFIRQWREFMNQAGVSSKQANISMMLYSDWMGLTDGEGHNYVRINHPGSKKSMDLDPILTIDMDKQIPWKKLSRPVKEVSRWISYVLNKLSGKVQSRFMGQYKKLFSMYPDRRWSEYIVRYRLGTEAGNKGDMKRARFYFLKALKLLPRGSKHIANIHLQIGKTYALEGNIPQAIKHIMIAEKIKPNYVFVRQWRMMVLIMQGRYKEADTIRRKIYAKNFTASADIMKLAALHARLCEKSSSEKAQRHVKAATRLMIYSLRLDPRWKRYKTTIVALMAQGKYERVREYMRKIYSIRSLIGKSALSGLALISYGDSLGTVVDMLESRTSRARKLLTHKLTLGAWGTHKISGAALLGYELDIKLPLPFMSVLVSADVGLNSDVNAMLGVHAGIKMHWNFGRHGLGYKFLGGAVSNLGPDVKNVEPEGRFAVNYEVMLGYSMLGKDIGAGAVGYALSAEVGIRFDKKFKDAYGVLGVKFVF